MTSSASSPIHLLSFLISHAISLGEACPDQLRLAPGLCMVDEANVAHAILSVQISEADLTTVRKAILQKALSMWIHCEDQ